MEKAALHQRASARIHSSLGWFHYRHRITPVVLVNCDLLQGRNLASGLASEMLDSGRSKGANDGQAMAAEDEVSRLSEVSLPDKFGADNHLQAAHPSSDECLRFRINLRLKQSH